MRDNFPACLHVTLGYEGGNVNSIHDPGGATSRGVTQRVYDAYRASKNQTFASVFRMTGEELSEIYSGQYWAVVHGDDLPLGVDLAVFDYAVNSGPVAAVKALQAALGLEADGHYGILTGRAVAGITSPRHVAEAVCDRRLSILQRLGTWAYFGRGWSARIAGIRKQASAIASA